MTARNVSKDLTIIFRVCSIQSFAGLSYEGKCKKITNICVSQKIALKLKIVAVSMKKPKLPF